MEGSVRAALAPVSVYSNGGHLQANEKQEHGKGSRRLSVGDISKKGAASLSPSKKRRSQSMGGALSEAAAVRAAASAASATELSPRKKARRSLVPGRSILKPAAPSQQHSYDNDSTGNFTTTLYTQNFITTTTAAATINRDDDPASSSDEAEVGGHDHPATTTMNMAMAADMTRRLSRRVSFAPTAQMREFSKEDEFCGDDSLSNIGGASSSSPARSKADQQPSGYIPGLSNALDARGVTGPIISNASTTASPSPAKPTHGRRRSSSIRTSNGHRRRSSVANAQSLVESFNAAPREPTASQESTSASVDQSLSTIMPVGDESNMLSNESAMDLADTSDMTTAFKSHFVFPSASSSQQSHSQTSLDSQEASFAASSANASNVMDMADADVTSAFALNTHLFGAPSPARTNPSSNIFTQPSPSHRSAASPFRLSTTSQPVSPAANRRRQSHSPSKKVQQQRRESEIKAAWEADAIRRRSAIYSHPTDSVPGTVVVTSSQEERTHREYHVPLGQEGIDEEDIAQLQRERARRGSAAFFASRQSVGSSQVSLFATSVTQTDTSVFAVHHGSDAGNGEEDNRFSPGADEENDDQTMDMSIVTDTRRVSSVFAVFTDRRQSTDSTSADTPQIEEVEDDSPSPMKTGSLYPSIQELQKETNHLQSPTPGDRALAFLDEDDEDDYNQTLGADNTADQLPAPVQQSEQELPEENVTTEGSPTVPEQDEEAPEEAVPQEEEEVVAQPAPLSVYDFQRHRLSIVPERRDEEELEEEDEELEDDDHTQDMEETAVYGSVLHQNPVRRLSMAHPRASPAPVSAFTSPAKSPARASARASASPAKQTMPSPAKQPSSLQPAEERRKSMSPEATKSRIPQPASVLKGRHSLSIPSVPPMAFTSLNEDGPQVQGDSLFKTVTSGSGVAQPVPSMGMSISSAALPSPARPPRSPSMRTGLTPDMRRLISDEGRRKSTLNMLASPGPMKALSALSGRESLAPTSEPFFDENAPHESEERPKISLDQFLSLTDMQFMDGLLSVSQAPGAGLKRKNGARPSLERGPSNALGGVSLADQISASAAVLPFLEGYRMMVSELRKSLRENSDVLDEMEEQIEEETPSLFLDYAAASEEDRAMLDTHFKVTRAYYRLQTRSEWYMFRNGVSTSIGEMLHGHLEGLTADKAIIDETYRRLTTDYLPSLRERAKDLAAELAKEKARQQELQECDQEHLNELRIAIKEQNSTIEDYKRDVAQTESTLERLQQKEEELDSQAAECKDAIETSKRVCDEVRYYTKTELWRLQDELDLLQYLHGWQLTQYDSTRIEICHHNELSITILFGSTGQVEDFELILLESRTSEAHDQNSSNRALLTGFLFDRLVAHVGPPASRQPHHKTAKDLLRKISNLWTRARQIRSAFALLAQRYPVHMSMLTKKSRSSGQPFLRASARIYAEAARAEFFVTFELTGEEINDAGPHAADLEDCVQDLGVSVEVKYGNVDREELSCIVRERVANAGNVALLEACQEAEARYS